MAMNKNVLAACITLVIVCLIGAGVFVWNRAASNTDDTEALIGTWVGYLNDEYYGTMTFREDGTYFADWEGVGTTTGSWSVKRGLLYDSNWKYGAYGFGLPYTLKDDTITIKGERNEILTLVRSGGGSAGR